MNEMYVCLSLIKATVLTLFLQSWNLKAKTVIKATFFAYKLFLKKKKKTTIWSSKNTFSTVNIQNMIIPGDPDGWSMFIFISHA